MLRHRDTSTNATSAQEWPPISAVPPGDSQSFCEGCGGLLGNLLERRTLTFDESLAIWREALGLS